MFLKTFHHNLQLTACFDVRILSIYYYCIFKKSNRQFLLLLLFVFFLVDKSGILFYLVLGKVNVVSTNYLLNNPVWIDSSSKNRKWVVSCCTVESETRLFRISLCIRIKFGWSRKVFWHHLSQHQIRFWMVSECLLRPSTA